MSLKIKDLRLKLPFSFDLKPHFKLWMISQLNGKNLWRWHPFSPRILKNLLVFLRQCFLVFSLEGWHYNYNECEWENNRIWFLGFWKYICPSNLNIFPKLLRPILRLYGQVRLAVTLTGQLSSQNVFQETFLLRHRIERWDIIFQEKIYFFKI